MTGRPTCLHDVVRRANADAPALISGERTMSFGELGAAIDRAAAWLAERTEPGARVALLGPNSIDYVVLLYAIPAAGRIAVPLNTRLADPELATLLADAGATLLLTDPTLAHREFDVATEDIAEPTAAVCEAPVADHGPATQDDIAWLIFTSGTTGAPKGAMLTHGSLLAASAAGGDARAVGADDVYLFPFPLFHVAAFNVVMVHDAGGPVVVLPGFDADRVFDACARHGVTQMSLAPTMLAMLFDHPRWRPGALGATRVIGYGAAPMPLPMLERVLTETEIGLSQGYGMTELSGNAVYLDAAQHRSAASDAPHLLGAAGVPAGANEVRIADDGEILVRGPQVMAGYWNRPELTAETIVDGWLHTGDIGRIDADGVLHVIDRKKDIIITGGENVASRQVEDALRSHPAVAAAAVIGEPDERWGEAVVGVVVSAGADADEAELIAHVRAQLAGYKTPKRIRFVDALPLNASGKVDKTQLRG